MQKTCRTKFGPPAARARSIAGCTRQLVDTSLIMTTDPLPLRCVTIDVEEYYHIESAFGRIDPLRWNDWPSRVAASVEMLLGLFSTQKIHATFFILGDVAKRNPQVPKLIAQQGHEIASHGTNHARLHRLGRESFRDDLIKCKCLLEDLTGQRVIGYRAPTFSIVPRTSWAIQVLVEEHFEYDASIFPVVHPNYGVPTAPDRPFIVKHVNAGDSEWSGKTAKILEIPPLTWKCFGRNLAVAGGGYFRLLPTWFMQQGLAHAIASRILFCTPRAVSRGAMEMQDFPIYSRTSDTGPINSTPGNLEIEYIAGDGSRPTINNFASGFFSITLGRTWLVNHCNPSIFGR